MANSCARRNRIQEHNREGAAACNALLQPTPAAFTAAPAPGTGTSKSWPAENNNGVPFHDNRSAGGHACNAGFFLAGGFGPRGNGKNGTPAGGLHLGGVTLEYYSNNDRITPFLLQAGQWTFTPEGRIAGSNPFEIGHFDPARATPTFHPIFSQSDNAGNAVTVHAASPIALSIRDGRIWLNSNKSTLGVAAFHFVPGGNLFYFGFKDRPKLDWDFDDVVISGKNVPEPATYALIGGGLLAFGILRRRRT